MAYPPSPRVAVIGAGISGVVAAAHLIKSGVDVTVFERAPEAGGTWVYNERPSIEPFYPSTKPSKGEDLATSHFATEPSPCYQGLKNNVITALLELTLGEWPPDTPPFVPHHVLKDYIQTIASKSGVHAKTRYGSSVTRVEKVDNKWNVEWITGTGEPVADNAKHSLSQESFDVVVVASGHYHAPRVPDIPGLKEWKQRWPNRISHSKSYRTPDRYKDKKILLIGSGVSSVDIARETGPIAKHVFQSWRKGTYDVPASLLPANGTRIGEVVSFEFDETAVTSLADDEPIPLAAVLASGQRICGIDNVVICTGYHITLPFLEHLHDDDVDISQASDTVIVTNGTQYHNLHKDIFYIPDPTLTFIGVPYFTATFTLFEFQAIALAAAVSGRADLPSENTMRKEYRQRLEVKGTGKGFHSLKGVEKEYVDELLDWVNADSGKRGFPPIQGHTAAWFKAREFQLQQHMQRDDLVEEVKEEDVWNIIEKVAPCPG